MKQTSNTFPSIWGQTLKKKSFLACIFTALALTLAPLSAQAEFSTLSETVIVAVDETTASSALYQAQRQALTRIVDAYLRSKTPQPVRNSQIIMDELWPNAKVFFESQQFLEQKSNLQTTAQVKIQFKIKTRDLTQAVDKILANLHAKKATYRLSVLVFETQDGNDTETSSLRLELENVLLKQGFSIIDPEYTEKMLTEKRTRFSEILKNDQKAAELAREQGADLAIVVNNQIKIERLAQNQQQATSHVVLKAIMASTGHKRFNIEEYIVGQGPNNERAQTESGKNAGRELGSRLVVIARVKDVDTRSFGGTQLVLDVFYDGLSGDLEAGIWGQLEAYREYPPPLSRCQYQSPYQV